MPTVSRLLPWPAALALALVLAPSSELARPFGTEAVAAAQTRLDIKDLKGRSVSLPRLPRRLLIDDGRYLVALSLIHPDPPSLLAGWPRDINRIGDSAYQRFLAKFPALGNVPQVSSSAGAFSLEKALAVKPDVALFTLGLGPSPEEVTQLEAAGVPVVFIDFFSQPFENLEPSLRILGKLTGREAQAEAFIAFRGARMNAISSVLRKTAGLKRPKVFLEAHAGMSDDCCTSPGKGNIGDYIEFVGGHNIGADVLPGSFGRLNLEYVVSQNPAIYIATGGPHLEKAGGMVVGPGYTPERARAALTKVAGRTGISSLSAVASGRVYGLSHQLLNSPLDILAVESLARWIHPELFGRLEPQKTLTELNDKFLAVPLEGAYWINLR
jgi:iron complex transport system substrate-binding protein